MAYILGFVLLVLCGFLGVLYCYDATPKVALKKAGRRLLGLRVSNSASLPGGPYQRVRTFTRTPHRPLLLALETSDGSGQACHPDVAHIPEGFGPKKWPYWMVCTPYPYLESRFENPEVFASYDGMTWAIPEGLQNPVVSAPPEAGDHNSDPDMIFFEDQLWVFFRQTLRSKSPEENSIYLMRSADGIQWSAPEKILSERDGTHLMSPAVIHDGERFIMWTVELLPGGLQIVRRESPNGVAWGPPSPCEIAGLADARLPWHIDVIQDENRLSAVLVSCERFGGNGSRMHYAFSEDYGCSWSVGEFLLDQVYEFEANVQYRGSLCKSNRGWREYDFWYSAASRSNVFSIAFLKLTRTSGNALIPAEPQHATGVEKSLRL